MLRVWPSGERQPALSHGINVTRLTNGGYLRTAALSPDGKYFAYTEQEGAAAHLWLRQVAGGQTIRLVTETEQTILGLTFAPDGQAIYFTALGQTDPQGAVYCVPTLGGAMTKLLTGVISPVALSPDGRQLAFIRQEDTWEDQRGGNNLVLADATGAMNKLCSGAAGWNDLASLVPVGRPTARRSLARF